jgi:hypothetical protein
MRRNKELREEYMKYGDKDALDTIDRYWKEYTTKIMDEGIDPNNLDHHEYLRVREQLEKASVVSETCEDKMEAFTPDQVDSLLASIITESSQHAIDVTKRHIGASVNDRVGYFVTALRRALPKLTDKSKEFSGLASALLDVDSWSDIGKIRYGHTWKRGAFKCRYLLPSGSWWECDFAKIAGICDRAAIGTTYVSDEKALDQTISAGLTEIESGMSALMNSINKAKQLNIESEKVQFSLSGIARELEEAIEAA